MEQQKKIVETQQKYHVHNMEIAKILVKKNQGKKISAKCTLEDNQVMQH